MRSGQKGGVENVHTIAYGASLKGTSFEFLTVGCESVVDHINSTPDESLNGKTPYRLALESFGEDTLKALQLRRIAPTKVNRHLKPLIRYNR